jgi:LemA protein
MCIVLTRRKNMKKTNWKVVALIIVGVLAIALMCIFGVQEAQNKAIAFEEQVNTAQSDIKVQEKRRVDLVYNLAGCVKEYDKHEAETLTGIVEKRGSTGDIENVTTAITAVAEAYPELKSNENYKNLMNELSVTENLIAEYRSNYNKQIKNYNRYVRKFPTKQFLGLLGYEIQDYQYLDYNAPKDAPNDLFKED